MAIPTTTIPEWATVAGTREASVDPTVGAQPGTPVGARRLNGVLGPFGDWLRYFAGLPLRYVVDRYILFCGDGPWLPLDADSLVETVANVDMIRVEKGGAGDAVARRSWGPTQTGGILTSVQVDVDDQNGAYTIDVWIRGSTSAGVAKTLQYQLTGTATGVQAMTLVSGTNDGIYGPIVTQARITAAADYVEVGRIYFIWEAIP